MNSWETHYQRDSSQLLYPDENLVRLLKRATHGKDCSEYNVVDLGCGSGRHLNLLRQVGFESVIGMDYSIEGLRKSGSIGSFNLVQNDNKLLPLKNNSIDIIVAWGSLHYGSKEDMAIMLNQIISVLKENGLLMGTLRSSRDTYLKKGTNLGNDIWITDLHDIDGATVSFYNEEELNEALSMFSAYEYGLMERTILGDMSQIISHWVFSAKKSTAAERK